MGIQTCSLASLNLIFHLYIYIRLTFFLCQDDDLSCYKDDDDLLSADDGDAMNDLLDLADLDLALTDEQKQGLLPEQLAPAQDLLASPQDLLSPTHQDLLSID